MAKCKKGRGAEICAIENGVSYAIVLKDHHHLLSSLCSILLVVVFRREMMHPAKAHSVPERGLDYFCANTFESLCCCSSCSFTDGPKSQRLWQCFMGLELISWALIWDSRLQDCKHFYYWEWKTDIFELLFESVVNFLERVILNHKGTYYTQLFHPALSMYWFFYSAKWLPFMKKVFSQQICKFYELFTNTFGQRLAKQSRLQRIVFINVTHIRAIANYNFDKQAVFGVRIKQIITCHVIVHGKWIVAVELLIVACLP